MKDQEIKKLVIDMEKGDNLAFEQLYNETKNTIYFICLSFLNNEQDAQDVMQEVYITAYNKAGQLIEKDKFIPWINQIAVNRCKNHLLKNSKAVFTDDGYDEVQYKESEIFLPEEYITSKEKRRIIMDIMRNCLSDIQYQTVILYYFNGLSVSEIADIMECPPGTVTYRLSVARAKLKEGVMFYESANDYKLHASGTVPFIASLLAAEAVGLNVPNVLPHIMSAISKGAAVTSVGAAEGVSEIVGAGGATGIVAGTVTKITGLFAKLGLSALKAKIAIGITVAAVVGVGATAIIMNNKNDKEASENIIQYEPVEPRTAKELVQYYIDEHGFEVYFEYKTSDSNIKGYDLRRLDENGGFRVDVQYYVDSDIPLMVHVYHYEKEYSSNMDEYLKLATLYCNNSKEEEQIKEFILDKEKEHFNQGTKVEEILIGDMIYKLETQDTFYYSEYCEFGAYSTLKSVFFIELQWEDDL